MVRISAVAILAFAASAIAAPQAPSAPASAPAAAPTPIPVTDFNGKPVSKEISDQVLAMEKEIDAKSEELFKSFTEPQKKLDKEMADISNKIGDLLGVPKDVKARSVKKLVMS
ncbi:hypothetical protein VFPPC_13567 [Pochonia chlamydosporia 170]|uniref:Uncharacterized protein n=1 Tax=Pochonia chlamydosporia 170 TaxID=1380566 RepID=A0A179FQ48_METCM|nr:hypothetical protein VFPPC_13567 [Pochonia chlamydosporia 170]OAQ67712.1 hypothetical protein VFPPC_13567 [Pochonia chlamydosporia 170]